MKIVYLTAGAGGMYCGACLHNNTLAVAVRDAGEDVLLAPAYTPITADEDAPPTAPMVYGGINVYLQEKWALFRHTPWFLDRLLDRPGLLRWLGRRSSSRRPDGLGPLAASMLRGEEGRQRKELDKLVWWLKREVQPDVVHLSTVMLVGMARRIQDQLGTPVVGTLSGEDIFVDALPEPHRDHCRRLLGERCAELAAMIALNGYYADYFARYAGVPRERIRVIEPGLNLAGHRPPGANRAARPDSISGLTIGYLARVCSEKGLHLLVEAFQQLARDPSLPPLRLVAGGYLDPKDQPYLDGLRAQLAGHALADRFRYAGMLDRAQKIALLQSFDILAVPTVYPESKGIFALEAWANGVPAVLPAHGAFPELVTRTGGGLLHRPHDAEDLARGLRQLALDPAQADRHGAQAQRAVHDHYHARRMAEETIALYREVRSTS